MLIHQPAAGRQLPQAREALEVAGVRVEKVAVLEAIVVEARGRERVADEEDGFRAGFADQQGLVVERLAGEKPSGHLELLPAPMRAAGQPAGNRDGVARQARQGIIARPFEDVP